MKYFSRPFAMFLPAFVLAGVFIAVYLIRTASADEQQPRPPEQQQEQQPPLGSGELFDPNAPTVHLSKSPANPNIDFDGHMKLAAEAAKHREARRLTEEDFIKMSQEEGAIILDARSKAKFDILHIKGAINLSFPDIDVESLKRHMPNKDTKVLIYCNNNFIVGAPPTSVNVTKEDLQDKAARAFPVKSVTMSLNISTYTVLYGYGYRNVYELGPLVDPARTKLALVSTEK